MNPDFLAALTRTAWRKSSYSTSTGNCVEVAPAVDGVILRHSKRPASGTIAFSPPAWVTFLRDARDGFAPTNGIVTITTIGTDTLVTSLATDVELRFDENEWAAFLAGVADGEFDFAAQPTA